MTRHRRMTQEDKIGRQGRDQLVERFVEHGWLVNRNVDDLGEDLEVKVYDDGVWSGIQFSVQVKSTAARRVRAQDGGGVRLRLRVRDLTHWEPTAGPLFVFLWDVSARTGFWCEVRTVIAALDAKHKGWRDKQTVTVMIPAAQNSSDDGLRRLRSRALEILLPSASSGRTFEGSFQLAFDTTTDAGREALERWRHFLDTGQTVELSAPWLRGAEVPEWFARLANFRFDQHTSLRLEPVPTGRLFSCAVEVVVGGELAAAVPLVELRRVAGGARQVTLATIDDRPGLRLSMELPLEPGNGRFKAGVDTSPASAREALNTVRFLAAMAQGAEVRFLDPRSGALLFEFVIGDAEALQVDDGYIEVLGVLAEIERRLCLSFSLPAGWAIAAVEEAEARRIHEILCTGRERGGAGTIEAVIERVAVERLAQEGCQVPVAFELRGEAKPLNLYGAVIMLGPVRHVSDVTVVDTPAALRARLASSPDAAYLPVRFAFNNAVVLYDRWITRHE